MLLALLTSGGDLHAGVPHIISYQGRIASDGVNFEGQGQFKFALVNAAATQTYWRNSPDTAPADGVPDAAVQLPVTQGLYSAGLGNTALPNMAAVNPAVFENEAVYLRVWFNDGAHGWEQLAPDQKINSVGYALMAGSVADGAITTQKLAPGAVTADRLAPGTSQFIDVTTFGADKTGATDCSAQVQAAIAAADASPSAKTVFFPEGTYKCNMTLPAMVNIKGAGSRWWVVPAGYSKTLIKPADNTKPVVSIVVQSGQEISNLTLIGNGYAISDCAVKVANPNTTDDFPGADLRFESVFIQHFSKGLWNRAGICIVANNLFVLDCTTCVLAERAASQQTPSTMTFIGGQFGGMYVSPPGAVCFRTEVMAGMNLIGCEMGNCDKLMVQNFNCVTNISGGNIESIHGDCMVELNGGYLNWSGSAIMGAAGNASSPSPNGHIPLVRVQGESGVVLNALRCVQLDNHQNLGGVLAIETWNTPDHLLQVNGFKGVVRRATNNTYATTATAYLPRHYPRDEYITLPGDWSLADSTAQQDVPGLSVAVPAGKFHITGKVQMAHTAGTGSKLGMFFTGTWPAEMTDLQAGNSNLGTVTEKSAGVIQASTNNSISNAPFVWPGGESSWVRFDSIVSLNTPGTLKWQAGKNAANGQQAKILKGSYIRVKALP
ncbi:glycosyl hydrolase family 28-related protein [Luteolibacter sp. Populi]|uniref:glycosyl hydrolase family 28-related protein n=1 Tax=Luteolibacter sp. Populi TaxID=3230487 RepID=UPI0034668546